MTGLLTVSSLIPVLMISMLPALNLWAVGSFSTWCRLGMLADRTLDQVRGLAPDIGVSSSGLVSTVWMSWTVHHSLLSSLLVFRLTATQPCTQ